MQIFSFFIMTRIRSCFTFILLLSSAFASAQIHTVWLDDLPLQTYSEGIRPVSIKSNYGHDTMRMSGVSYSRGFGMQSIGLLAFNLNSKASHFSALVGMDDDANKQVPVTFYVVADGKILFKTNEMNIGDAPVKVDIDLASIKQFGLLVTDQVGGLKNKRTYVNWANAKIEMMDNSLPGYIENNGEKYILTPKSSNKASINSAKIFGAKPGNPFLYTIAATGDRPMIFSAKNLPGGLSISSTTGFITGTVKQSGTYISTLLAKNAFGIATQKLVIKIGDTIALTPPMGWNGWNAWEQKINREKVMASADAMVQKGLRNHGWVYVNIDDAWQGIRTGPDTALQPNARFSLFKGMVDYIHLLGLKAGLYSSPYIGSYAGYVSGSSAYPAGGETRESILANKPNGIGKYRFEKNDAKQMAEWGFDFLKYDWRMDVESASRMSDALKQSGRDVVFSLSNNAPIEKAGDWARLSNMFRTGPDIKDSWTSLFTTTFSLDAWAPFTGPGHWPDPDMMIVGKVSIGPILHDTRLTPDEQYSHISIFSLLAAPMLIGCPIEQLDDFTLNLLTNDEVIAINQDPAGKPGRLLLNEDGVQVWVKPMEDGSYGVGLFNIDGYGTTPQSYFRWGNELDKKFKLDFLKIGLKGKWKVRDLWRQKELGRFVGSFVTAIPHHGVVMLRIFPQ
jgi:alpha-galactosidase